MEAISLGRDSANTSAAIRPFFVTLADRYSPLGVVVRSSCEISTPDFLANACAAGVGCPSLKATLTDGPVTCSVTSGCAGEMPGASTAKRRGVSRWLISPACSNRSRSSNLWTRWHSSSEAASIILAGISSQPISSRKSGIVYWSFWPVSERHNFIHLLSSSGVRSFACERTSSRRTPGICNPACHSHSGPFDRAQDDSITRLWGLLPPSSLPFSPPHVLPQFLPAIPPAADPHAPSQFPPPAPARARSRPRARLRRLLREHRGC